MKRSVMSAADHIVCFQFESLDKASRLANFNYVERFQSPERKLLCLAVDFFLAGD